MEINKAFQANVFINALNFQGLIEELALPGPTSTRVEHATVSSLGTLNLHSGFDLMEGRFKWKGMSETIDRFASDVMTVWDVQVRFINVKHAGTPNYVKESVVFFLKLRFRNAPNSELTPKSDVDTESTFDVDYIRKEVNGRPVYEYDPVNFKYEVNGVDKLAEDRRILGLA